MAVVFWIIAQNELGNVVVKITLFFNKQNKITFDISSNSQIIR